MKILVTGGAGFIGSHLTQALVKRRHNVTIVDTFTNFSGGSFYDNFDYRKKLIADAYLIRTKASNPKVWKKKFDVVVHLAGIPIVNPKKGDFFKENVQETQRLLSLTHKNGTRRFIFMSTIYAYGPYRGRPYKEDFSLQPTDGYGTTKVIGEYLTQLYFKDREWIIVRTAGVIGCGDHNNRISRLIVEKYSHLPDLTLTKDCRRIFIHIDDLVTGLVKTVESKVINHTFNIVGGTLSLENFAQEAKKHLPDLKWKLRERPKDEPQIGPASIDKAHNLLGFIPQFTVKEAIRKYIRDFKKNVTMEQFY